MSTKITGSNYADLVQLNFPASQRPEKGVDHRIIAELENIRRELDNVRARYASAVKTFSNAFGEVFSANPEGCMSLFREYEGDDDGRKDGESVSLEYGELSCLKFDYFDMSDYARFFVKTPYGYEIEISAPKEFRDTVWKFHQDHFSE